MLLQSRARLIASSRGQKAEGRTEAGNGRWSLNLVKPEKGCLLLSHPLMFSERQTYFSQVLCTHGSLHGPQTSCLQPVPRCTSIPFHHLHVSSVLCSPVAWERTIMIWLLIFSASYTNTVQCHNCADDNSGELHCRALGGCLQTV